MKEFRGTLDLPSYYVHFYSKNCNHLEEFFIRFSFNLKLTLIKEFLTILSP